MQPSTSAEPSIASRAMDATNATGCNTFEGAPDHATDAQAPADHPLAKCEIAEIQPEAHSPLPATTNVSDQTQIAIPNSQIDETNPFALSDRQRLALEMILAGLPDAAIGKQLGLSRTTIYRWRNFNCAFLSELNRRRLDNWNASHEKLRSLLPRALAALSAGLKSDDLNTRLRSARTILSHVAPDPESLKPTDRDLSPAAVLHSFIYADRHRRKGSPHYERPISEKESGEAVARLQRKLSRTEPAQPG